MKNTISIYKLWRDSGFIFEVRPRRLITGACQMPDDIIYDYIKEIFMICKYIDTNDIESVLTEATLDTHHHIFDNDILIILRKKLLYIYYLLNLDYPTLHGFRSMKEGCNHPIEEILGMINHVIHKYIKTIDDTNKIEELMKIENYCYTVLVGFYNYLILYYKDSYTQNQDIRELLTLVKFIALYERDYELLCMRDNMYWMLAIMDITMNNVKYINKNLGNTYSCVYGKYDKYPVISYLFLDTLNDLFDIYLLIYKRIHDNLSGEIDLYTNMDELTFSIKTRVSQITKNMDIHTLDFKHNMCNTSYKSHIIPYKESPFSYKLPSTLDEVFDYINIKEQSEDN